MTDRAPDDDGSDADDVSNDDAVPMSDERRELVARLAIKPGLRHAAIAQRSAARALGGGEWSGVLPTDALTIIAARAKQLNEGDTSPAIGLLMAQAMTLDALFTELAVKAGDNMGEYPQAVERYMRLALKAQSNSRATIEAMAKISRGGEQVVRHIHVDNRGGQAVIAETVQTGGYNGLHADQPDAFASERQTPVRSEDSGGVSLSEQIDAERSLPDAWRDVPGSAEREPECLEARRALGGGDADRAPDQVA